MFSGWVGAEVVIVGVCGYCRCGVRVRAPCGFCLLWYQLYSRGRCSWMCTERGLCGIMHEISFASFVSNLPFLLQKPFLDSFLFFSASAAANLLYSDAVEASPSENEMAV